MTAPDGDATSGDRADEHTAALLRHLAGLAADERCAITFGSEAWVDLAEILPGVRSNPAWGVHDDAKVVTDGGPALEGDTWLGVRGRGARVFLADGAELRDTKVLLEGPDAILFVGRNARLTRANIVIKGRDSVVAMGADTTWESGSCLCTPGGQRVLIGDDCMISNEVLIRTNDGHGIFDSSTRELLNAPEPVVLGRHVWIGHGCHVAKGTRVGEGAVVGAASVARGSLAAGAVHAGAPTRQVRDGVAWSRTLDWEDVPGSDR